MAKGERSPGRRGDGDVFLAEALARLLLAVAVLLDAVVADGLAFVMGVLPLAPGLLQGRKVDLQRVVVVQLVCDVARVAEQGEVGLAGRSLFLACALSVSCSLAVSVCLPLPLSFSVRVEQ